MIMNILSHMYIVELARNPGTSILESITSIISNFTSDLQWKQMIRYIYNRYLNIVVQIKCGSNQLTNDFKNFNF